MLSAQPGLMVQIKRSNSGSVIHFSLGGASETGDVACSSTGVVAKQATDASPQKHIGGSGKFIDGTSGLVIDRPRATGNLVEDNRRKQLNASLVNIVQWCVQKPDHLLSVESLMQGGGELGASLELGNFRGHESHRRMP